MVSLVKILGAWLEPFLKESALVLPWLVPFSALFFLQALWPEAWGQPWGTRWLF
jgi:hypothetical protein